MINNFVENTKRNCHILSQQANLVTMYAIRSTKGIIHLTESHKIDNKVYTEINLSQLGPKTLRRIYDKLPQSEKCARICIITALMNKHYKGRKDNIYFGPPLKIGNEMITHINPKKESVESLKLYLIDAIIQNPYDEKAIQELKDAIRLKEPKKRMYDISQDNLPIKKRFYEEKN